MSVRTGEVVEPFQWRGISKPNGTFIPDEVFDVLMPHLTDAEFKVFLYICRRTFGFRKDSDDISTAQMVSGIVTRDGRVLDSGTGMSKSSVIKAVRSLVEKGCIEAIRNKDPRGGDLPSSYSVVFLREPTSMSVQRGRAKSQPGGVQNLDPLPGADSGLRGVQISDPQQTVKQITEGFDNSNYLRGQNVDNMGITGYLDNLIVDFSREFGDTGHLASNRKQVRNIFAALDLTEEQFVERYVYQARQKTKHQTKVRNKMAYFFATLRELCGLADVEEA